MDQQTALSRLSIRTLTGRSQPAHLGKNSGGAVPPWAPDPASPFSPVSWAQTLSPPAPLPQGKQSTWFRAGLQACSEGWLVTPRGLAPCQGSGPEPLNKASGVICGLHSGTLSAVPSSRLSVLPGGEEI